MRYLFCTNKRYIVDISLLYKQTIYYARNILLHININMKFYYIGNIDGNGKSSLINSGISKDNTISSLTSTISELLPERVKLHHSHPDWLMDNTIDVLANCEIKVTFVDEGAGYRNSAGYFIYKTSNPPKSIDFINECYFFFPNASKSGSGGSLTQGDRIRLPFSFNYDGDKVTPNSYTFQQGYSVGFILYPNGWTGSDVNKYIVPYTSISKHNPEIAPELKYHTACIKIPGTDRLLLSFEDLRRDTSSCDHDFNDLVMIVDTDISSIGTRYIDTVKLEEEKDDPDIPKSYTIGYKKIYTLVGIDTVEAVAKLYIPKTATVVQKKGYKIRIITDQAYVKDITVVARKTGRTTTNNYIGRKVDSGFSWYKNSFIYTADSYVNQTIDHEKNEGIHFFSNYGEAEDYDFTPTYKY